jgi:type II secretory pathway pseudopilin PulG
MFDDNYNREEVDHIIESSIQNIVEFRQSLEQIAPKQIEDDIAPMSLNDFITLTKTLHSKFDYLIHLINELKEFRNTSEIFEELNHSLNWFDHEIETLQHSPTDTDKIQRIIDILEKSIIFLNSKILPIRISNQQSQQLIEENLAPKIKEIEEKIKSLESARLAYLGQKTEEIYSNASKKHIRTARFYDVLLLATLGIFYYITSNFFENFQMISIFQAIKKSSSEAQTLAIFFFITKLTIVSIVITLATIFIRRSSHFRKLHDQANQTSLELNALPNYLRQVDSEHHSEIYKEMIPKFFGKELDQSQNDKVGDLVKDQLAAGTELIKASAEMVKNAKSLSGSADKTKITKANITSTEDKTKSAGEG